MPLRPPHRSRSRGDAAHHAPRRQGDRMREPMTAYGTNALSSIRFRWSAKGRIPDSA
jgi:hypothetical protein